MSKGWGRWEREIMHATASICITPVSAVVRSVVPEPSRSDFTSARRAAKTLATESQLTALYCWSCQRCGRVQDRDTPVRCCGAVRSSLAVARPGRMLPRLAPAPAGIAPPWIALNDAPAAPAGLAVPAIGDLARLAAQRLWETLERGTCPVRPGDVVMLTKLAREAEHDHHADHPDERWQATLRELLWLARSHLRDGWPAFAADVKANATLLDLWPRPGPGP